MASDDQMEGIGRVVPRCPMCAGRAPTHDWVECARKLIDTERARADKLETRLREVQADGPDWLTPTERRLVEAALNRANTAEVQRDKAKARAEAAEREADRLRHGVSIEGDFVCPDALRADEAERERALCNVPWPGRDGTVLTCCNAATVCREHYDAARAERDQYAKDATRETEHSAQLASELNLERAKRQATEALLYDAGRIHNALTVERDRLLSIARDWFAITEIGNQRWPDSPTGEDIFKWRFAVYEQRAHAMRAALTPPSPVASGEPEGGER